MSAPSYIFGGDTGVTADDLTRRRAIVDAMLKQAQGSAPQNIGEGINSIGRSIAAALSQRALRNDETALRDRQAGLWNDLGGAMTSGGGSALAYDPAGTGTSPVSPTSSAPPASATASAGASPDPVVLPTDAALPAGMRNNNPGNIKFVGQGRDQGVLGPSRNTDQGDPQAVFESADAGMAAMHHLLAKKYAGGKITPDMIIAGNGGWTPGNHQAAANVARSAGLGPNDDIGFGDPTKAARFMRGLLLQEHGAASNAYSDDIIMRAVGVAPAAIARQAPAAGAPEASAAPMLAQRPVQVASLDPSAGMDSALAYDPRGRVVAPPTIDQALNKAFAARGAGRSGQPMQPAPLPPAQTVAANPLPPDASPAPTSTSLPSNVSPDAREAAANDPGFDGFSRTGRYSRIVQALAAKGGPGLPSAPAAPDTSADGASPGQPSVPAAPDASADRTPGVQRVAQALLAQNGGNTAAIMNVLQSPYASDEQRQIATSLLNRTYARQDAVEKRAYEASDPDNVLKRRYTQAQIDALGLKQPNTTDDIREYQFAVQGGYQGSFADYQQSMKKAGASSTVLGGGENKQVFDAMADSASGARSAVSGLKAIRDARAAIDAGGIFGAGADTRLGLQKIGAYLGVTDPAAITNTETFRAAIAPQVSAVLKSTVGSANISNTDREFAEKAAGGNITLEPTSIKRLLNIMEKASTEAVAGHMSRLDKVYPAGGQFDRERALFGVDMPDMGEPPAAGSPVPSPAAAAPTGGGTNATPLAAPTAPKRARNPQTGQVLELQGNKWVPVQ